jgi:hypothetical protein
LGQLFDIARWFFVQLDGGKLEATPKYTPPPPEPASAAKTKDALEKLRLAEAKYEAVLKRLDEETKKRLEAERAATEATRTAEENAERADQAARCGPEGRLCPRVRRSDHAPPPHRPGPARRRMERRHRWQEYRAGRSRS